MNIDRYKMIAKKADKTTIYNDRLVKKCNISHPMIDKLSTSDVKINPKGTTLNNSKQNPTGTTIQMALCFPKININHRTEAMIIFTLLYG